MKTLFSVFIALMLSVSVKAVEPDTCEIMDYKKLYIGMTFEEFSEQVDIYGMSFFADEKKHQVLGYLFLNGSDVNRLDFVFEVDQWKVKPVEVIPNEARLSYLMISYNIDINVEQKLFDQYGAPALQLIPETGKFYDFDNQWKCISVLGDAVKITHIHKRVTYELDK